MTVSWCLPRSIPALNVWASLKGLLPALKPVKLLIHYKFVCLPPRFSGENYDLQAAFYEAGGCFHYDTCPGPANSQVL